MFENLEKIHKKPKLFSHYTTQAMWDDPYVSTQMLSMHLAQEVDSASRNHEFIKNSALWIAEEFELNEDSTICDLGCGPGLYTEEFIQTGANVTGVDFSANSIDFATKSAKKKKLNINYLYQNYLEFKPKEKFDLVTMIFCDFCVLNPKQRSQLLKNIASMLKPRGKFLFDVFTPNLYDKISESATLEKNAMGQFWSKKPYYMFLNTFKYEKETAFLDKYTVIKKDDDILEIYNWIKCYTLKEIEAELKKCGLKVLETYSNVAGSAPNNDSDEMALVACKI